MDPNFAVNRSGTRSGQRGASDRGRFDFDDRISSVGRAVFAARRYVPSKFAEATGYELKEIAAGIVPGLLMLLAIIGLSTIVGAAAGAALGALAGGVGAIPGAAAGAALGFNVSLAILNFLGLAFLAVYIGEALLDGVRVAGEAAEMAWHAIDHGDNEDLVVESAAAHLAYAGALVFRGVLQGIVAYLLAKGTAAVASRVPELVARLRASKLGGGFADWVSKNWQGLIDNPKLARPPAATSSTGAPSSGATSATSPPAGGVSTPTKPAAARPTTPAPFQPGPRQTSALERLSKSDPKLAEALKKIKTKDQFEHLKAVRRDYHSQLKKMKDGAAARRAQGQSEEDVARWLSNERTELKKIEWKAMDPKEVAAIKARNLEKYGNEFGPTADDLFLEKGSWGRVSESATKSNADVNDFFEID